MRELQGPKEVHQLVICRVGAMLCGVPLAHVIETLRPLPVEPFPRAPRFVQGVSLIRGRPTPVLDLRLLLGAPGGNAGRYVTLRVGSRTAALAVDSVVGIQGVSSESLPDLPPLLGEAQNAHVAAVGSLDAELLLVLDDARLLPEESWQALERKADPA